MQLGMIGLGRMGANLVRRLAAGGHDCVGYDVSPEATDALAGEGHATAGSLEALVEALAAPRAVWVMVPAAHAGPTIEELATLLTPGDTIIDGGNSNFREAIDRAPALAERGIDHVDVGTSGGVHGLDRGFCLMVGGRAEPVRRLAPVFETLAPGVDAAQRTGAAAGPLRPGEQGWLHCGPPGAGHFVKMVHNGVEYAMMAALAEGLAILDQADLGSLDRAADAETAPLDDPHHYRFPLDVAAIAEVWRRGSVVSSWLVDLAALALADEPDLGSLEGRVSDSGEGRWTVQTAVDLAVPAHTITAALYQRFSSRGRADFADRVLSALRREFGGHHERPGGP